MKISPKETFLNLFVFGVDSKIDNVKVNKASGFWGDPNFKFRVCVMNPEI